MLFYGNAGILCLKGSNVFGRHSKVESPSGCFAFSTKRFYMRKSLSFDLEAFACEKIGLTRPVKMNPSGRSTTDIAQIKRRLLKAIQELESIGCRGKPAEGGEGEGKTRGRSTQKSRGGSGTSPRERRLGKEPNSDPR